ncbi:fungal-specific transcription factor domain-containing protein [Xylogone sp. PMI_703]|nr:fungal-specific transcription factor domain-containing protein [Xylogone sp. PMI_703]
MPDHRSTLGCWTCRLRRKKCDEVHPCCSACRNLEIECDGYGPKPDWMDGGAKERLHLEELKRSIKRARGQRSRLRQDSIGTITWMATTTPDVVPKDWRTESAEKDLPSSSSSLSSIWSSSLTPDPENPSISKQSSVISSYSQHSVLLRGDEHAGDTPGEMELDEYSLNTTPETAWNIPVLESPLKQDATKISMPIVFESAIETASLWSTGVLQDAFIPTDISRPGLFGPSAPLIVDDEQIVTLMYYFDHVFHLLFPFYTQHSVNSNNSGPRGWLLVLISRSVALHYAVLSLGAYSLVQPLHQNNKNSKKVSHQSRWWTFHMLALQEFRNHIERIQIFDNLSHTEKFKAHLEALGCVVHLISLQILQGSLENWLLHMTAGIELLSQVTFDPSLELYSFVAQDRSESIATTSESRPSIDEPSQISEESTRSPSSVSPPPTAPRNSSSYALSFFTSGIVFFDIIWGASTRSAPLLHSTLELILEVHNVHIEALFGCQNWVIIALSKILELDRWKIDAEKSTSLSFIELVVKATKIKDMIIAWLDGTAEQAENENHHCNDLVDSISPDEVLLVTKTFARSALTLLYVVVSGPHPHLDEIRTNIVESMKILETVANEDLIQHVVWPLCVTGCMVETIDQRLAFQKILENDGIDNLVTKEKCSTVMRIAKRCWQMRDDEGGCVDWTDAMASLDCKRTLI